LRAGLGWQQAQSLSEAEVEAKLFVHIGRSEPDVRSAVDFPWVHRELRRTGVTLQLLWSDYRLAAQQAGRRPYQYSQFCDLYASWRGQQRLSMRQTHRPGEKLFVDYSGKRPSVTDPVTGEQREVELYVAVLGASNYTFAEVTFSQTIPDFTASTVRALEYFGASPKIVVPDQLRSAVARPDRYDPDINEEGGTMIVPGHGRLCDESDVGDYRDMVTIVRDRVRDMVQKKMSLAQVKGARPTRDYDGVYGQAANSGDLFVETVYRSLTSATSAKPR